MASSKKNKASSSVEARSRGCSKASFLAMTDLRLRNFVIVIVALLDKLAVWLGVWSLRVLVYVRSLFYTPREAPAMKKRKNPTLSLPAHVSKWARYAENKRFGSEETYLKKISSLCECLPIKPFLFKFILLPFIGALSIFAVYKGIVHHGQKEVTTSYAQEDIIARDAIASVIDTANSLPMSFPAPEKRIATRFNTRNHLEYVSLTIHKSIYSSFRKSGFSSGMAKQFIEVFSGTVNFAKDLHDGDRCVLLFANKPQAKGAKASSGHVILAAEIVQKNNKVHRAIRFTDSKGQTAYYTPQGFSLKESFLRFPVNYRRIGDRFSYHRWHPIFNFYRPHLGVDFVAASGTPIKAAGNGRIALLGRKGGYGKAIVIKHDGKYSTLYGHLSRFAKLHVGSQVRKGQVIGYVGSTGIATGPHLHYEVHVYGIPRDPLKVRLPHLAIPPGKDRARFFALARGLMAELHMTHTQYAVGTLYYKGTA